MLSVLLVFPIKNVKLAKGIVQKIQKLNENLLALDIRIDQTKILKTFVYIILPSVLFLFFTVGYDAYVSLLRNQNTTFKYWIVAIIPSIFLGIALLQSICVLLFLRTLFKYVNKAISSEIRSEIEPEPQAIEKPNNMFLTRVQISYPCQQKIVIFPKIFFILGDLNEICYKVEAYFGPTFLATFTTIFVVTSIQLFYCYVILHFNDETKALWYLFVAINTVVINMLLVGGITAICQSITNQVS